MKEKVSFLTNTDESHKETLIRLFKDADEVIFAVGFLKLSGFQNLKETLKLFCKNTSSKSTFYIGIGMGQTDPKALKKLHSILKRKTKHNLVICTPDAGIFHPKLYVFIKDDKATVVAGSANLTNAGWEVNDEVSIITEIATGSPVYKELSVYFNQLSEYYDTGDTAEIIKSYTGQLENYKGKHGHKPTFRFKRKHPDVFDIDMPGLQAYYKKYKKSDKFIEPKTREKQYEKARKNLDVLASNKRLGRNQFHALFGPLVGHKAYKPKLWHSGSIHRKTYGTLDYPTAFRNIVREVRKNLSEPLPVAYDNVIGLLNKMRKKKTIYGIGENIVAEIFLSYDANKFANLNDNPLEVLDYVGKEFPAASGFKGEDYKEYVDLLNWIKEELEMDSLLEIDSFFNYVYWNKIEE